MHPHKVKLRICVLGNAWSPHIQNRTRVLADLGHIVTLLSADTADIPGVEVRRITPKLGLRFCGWSILFSYLDAIRQFAPDVIHVHYASGFHAWSTLLLPEYPAMVSLMGRDILFEEQGNPTAASRRLTLDTLERAATITSKSEHMTNYLGKVAPGVLEKTKLVRWGIDPSLFRPSDGHDLRNELGIDPDAPVILCPRGFAPIYNIDVVLRAFARVRELKPVARLLLFEFGQDPEYRQYMDSIIEEKGLQEAVVIIGDVPHADMALYYNLADVVVSIPSSDGMPQSLFEALACEAAVIISDLPHYREIVRHGREVHATPIAEEAVADAMLFLLDDPATRTRLGQNGREMVIKNANFERDAKRAEALLATAATGRKPRRPYAFPRLAGLLFLHYAEAVLTGKER